MPSPRTFVRALVAAFALLAVLAPSSAGAATLPTYFEEDTVFSGLSVPTAVRFAPFPDTRAFVAEKNGKVKVFDSPADTSATTLADLGANVHDYVDRGLLGLAVDPSFPSRPYVYVLYTFDAAIGGTAGRWGDTCPSTPGGYKDGCVVSGRLSRLQVNPVTNTMSGPEQVLVNDWCQQYPSHSMGDLAFGADGMLYVSAGEGAAAHFTDYGQDGSPRNPCGDPGDGRRPGAEGGALRSQDLRTSADPTGLGGAVLRLNPDTGAAAAGNPLGSSSDLNSRRIVAYGLRHPHRMAFRPGTNDLYVGDLGWESREEIDRIDSPTSSVKNFGWPCYEGSSRQDEYEDEDLTLCENLYDAGGVASPYHSYRHSDSGGPCDADNGSAITGLAFYPGGPFPDSYDDALFYADAARGCIWAMRKGSNGLPSPSNVEQFAYGLTFLTDLQHGSDGALWYTDPVAGSIKRIVHRPPNSPPVANATATPTGGIVPLTVNFDGRGSSDPNPGDTLSYAWDLDGDGDYDDSTSATPSRTYNDPGAVTVRLRVTDQRGASGTTSLTISPQPAPPVNTALPTISGTARDGQTLTSTTGSWAGSPTISYTRQWQRCDAAGAACSDISGANGSTYALTSTDVGKTLRVRVTADNAAPGTVSATSAQTAVVDPSAPANAVLPAISGTARDGETLSSTTGTWTGTPPISFTRQWQRCDSAGAACSNIAGATAATYTLGEPDVGKRLRVVVTADNAAPGTVSATSAASALVDAAPPANTALPTVSGTARDGETLSSTTGTWTGTPPISFTRQWRRCDAGGSGCSDISGATGGSYTLTAADFGKTIRVVVTADNAAAGTVSATSAASAVVDAAPPVNGALPAISGTARDGETLSSTTGTWTGTPTITFTRQWQRCDAAGAGCSDISGANGNTYALTSSDVGKTLRVRVTADNAAAGTVSATSGASAVIQPAAPVNTALPAISGTARDGETLSSTTGSWSGTPPISFTRQWRRCDSAGSNCADIGGATGAGYTLTAADVGKTIRLQVTADNDAPGTVTATSAQSAVVAADPPANTALPVISGSARDGATLTSTTGSWTGTPTITFSRRWRRCDSAGSACADIAGATGESYELTPADTGKTIRVVVTADNAAPGTVSATSAQTAVVVASPPVNTALPAISGTARDGGTLSSTTGTWAGTPTISFSREWLRCDAAGGACAVVAGQTGPTLALSASDIGMTFRVRVTADNPLPGTVVVTSDPSAVVTAAPPANTALPAISGTARDGETLSSSMGTWTGTPTISLLRQWLRCDAAGANCAEVPGAVSSTYALRAADVGRTLRVKVVADNDAPGTVAVTSAPSAMVAAIPPLNGAIPMVSGEAREGETLVSTLGFWTGTPSILLRPSWLRCDAAGGYCSPIGGAAGESYLLGGADVGHTIRARVTADNAAPGSAESQSEPTLVVEPAFPNVPPPSTPSSDAAAGQLPAGGSGSPRARAGRIHFRKRRGKPSLWLSVRCLSASCDLYTSVRIVLPGRKGVQGLFPVRRHLTSGGRATLRVPIPKKLARRIASAARRKQRVRAKVGVYAVHGKKPVRVVRKTVKYRRR